MQRIIIRERDLTSNVEVVSSYDVAYVPGFMSLTDDSASPYYRKPTLFTSKYAFQKAIGMSAPQFASDQAYPVWGEIDDQGNPKDGFPTRAIPVNGAEPVPMFAQGDTDLGYRIALYLLSLGMPVYYEVMNNSNADAYSVQYNYTKVDTDAEVFNPTVTYYQHNASASGTATVSSYVLTDGATVQVTSATFENAVSHVDGEYTFAGSAEAHAESSNESLTVTLDADTFAAEISNTPGDYVFTYDGTNWKYNGSNVTLSEYGITVTGTPSSSDTITATYAAVWKLDGNNVTPASYGISITGSYTPTLTDNYSIVINYVIESAPESVTPGSASSAFSPVAISAFVPGENYYTVAGTESCPVSVESMYAGLKSRFSGKDDSFDTIGDYSIKYITSGGYPTFEYASGSSATAYSLMQDMIDTAATRQDAVALIDHTNNPMRDLYLSTAGGSGNSVIDIVRTVCANIGNASYGAMFTPWYACAHSAISDNGTSAFVPASVGYLSALAVQIRDYNPWLAVSGVTRGRVPNLTVSDRTGELHTVQLLTNNIADSYQALPTDRDVIQQVSINPITYIRNVGYCIWGNRTLRNNIDGTTSLSFLNIRSVVSDIKKTIFEASQRNLFEQNTDVTWINFRAAITPILDRMVSNYILTDYSIVRYRTDPETGDPVPSYKVLAVIRIQPIHSIEVFDLTVQLENAEVIVSEQ